MPSFSTIQQTVEVKKKKKKKQIIKKRRRITNTQKFKNICQYFGCKQLNNKISLCTSSSLPGDVKICYACYQYEKNSWETKTKKRKKNPKKFKCNDIYL